MPMPKRSSVDDFFAQLSDVQRSHLETLRKLSRDADSQAREELKWNLPVFVRGEKTSLWMLQSFKNHCSLRFPPPFFGTQRPRLSPQALRPSAGQLVPRGDAEPVVQRLGARVARDPGQQLRTTAHASSASICSTWQADRPPSSKFSG
jgi:hypothetical protein